MPPMGRGENARARIIVTTSTAAAAAAVAAGEVGPGGRYDAPSRRRSPPSGTDSRHSQPRLAITRRCDPVRVGDETGAAPPPTGADRTSLVAFIRDDHPGALLEILEQQPRGVNLTWIESRPTGNGMGRYCFAVDCEGHVADARG